MILEVLLINWCTLKLKVNFFIMKLRVQLFCAYILGLYFPGARLLAQKLRIERWWNWPVISFISHYYFLRLLIKNVTSRCFFRYHVLFFSFFLFFSFQVFIFPHSKIKVRFFVFCFCFWTEKNRSVYFSGDLKWLIFFLIEVMFYRLSCFENLKTYTLTIRSPLLMCVIFYIYGTCRWLWEIGIVLNPLTYMKL